MTIQVREKRAVFDSHVEQDTGNYINVKKWLTRIYTVTDIDAPQGRKPWVIDGDCKLIYAYLFNFGKCHGWNKIYPNQDMMEQELGIKNSTLKRKIKILGESGLIDVIKQRQKTGYDSNRYRVKQPAMIGRRKWHDVSGTRLVGKMYDFNMSIFKKKVGGCKED